MEMSHSDEIVESLFLLSHDVLEEISLVLWVDQPLKAGTAEGATLFVIFKIEHAVVPMTEVMVLFT